MRDMLLEFTTIKPTSTHRSTTQQHCNTIFSLGQISRLFNPNTTAPAHDNLHYRSPTNTPSAAQPVHLSPWPQSLISIQESHPDIHIYASIKFPTNIFFDPSRIFKLGKPYSRDFLLVDNPDSELGKPNMVKISHHKLRRRFRIR